MVLQKKEKGGLWGFCSSHGFCHETGLGCFTYFAE